MASVPQQNGVGHSTGVLRAMAAIAGIFDEESNKHNLYQAKKQAYMNITSRWDVADLFDEELRDPLNFDLDENAVGAISALLVGLTIVLLTDLDFRLCVRSRRDSVTTFAVYRRSLLVRFSSPIDGLRCLFHACSRWIRKTLVVRTEDKAMDLNEDPDIEPNKSGSGVPRYQRVFVALAGVVLIAVELVLIFLATNRTVEAGIDRHNLRAVAFRADTEVKTLLVPTNFPCTARPLTLKNGFIAQSTVYFCNPIDFVFYDGSIQLGGDILVSVQYTRRQLYFIVDTDGLTAEISQYTAISTHDGQLYKIVSPVTQEEVEKYVPAVMARHGFSLKRTWPTTPVTDTVLLTWTVNFRFNSSAATLDPVFVRGVQVAEAEGNSTLTPAQIQSQAWHQYVGAILRGALGVTGRSRAVNEFLSNSMYLDEYEGALVFRQRPWLSVGGCISLCAAVFLVWVIVAFGLGWEGGLDERISWVHQLQTVHRVGDFHIVPEEKIMLNCS